WFTTFWYSSSILAFISKPIGAFLVGSLINAFRNDYSGYIMACLGFTLFIVCMIISFRAVLKKLQRNLSKTKRGIAFT
ncbi:hypothetical protein CHH77_20800, partial [Shouchella clausii]